MMVEEKGNLHTIVTRSLFSTITCILAICLACCASAAYGFVGSFDERGVSETEIGLISTNTTTDPSGTGLGTGSVNLRNQTIDYKLNTGGGAFQHRLAAYADRHQRPAEKHRKPPFERANSLLYVR